jgi:hypothetical protein
MMKKRKGKNAGEVASSPFPSDDAWRARDDLRTIQQAHEVIRDSSRFKAAKSEAKRQKESLDRIARLEGKRL